MKKKVITQFFDKDFNSVDNEKAKYIEIIELDENDNLLSSVIGEVEKEVKKELEEDKAEQMVEEETELEENETD